MIKAVFFDLFYTLVRYDPPREELQAKALKDFGIDIPSEALSGPFFIADEFIYQEIARKPLSQRSEEDKISLYVQYMRILLQEARIDASEHLILSILKKMKQYDMNLALYDDVMPALSNLKASGLILGLISNIDRNMTSLLNELGLSSLLQVVVTSNQLGFYKPQPEIFQEALRKGKVEASEAIYVGDQYQIDVVGANKVGMKGILLDRSGHFKQAINCPRIKSLTQVTECLSC